MKYTFLTIICGFLFTQHSNSQQLKSKSSDAIRPTVSQQVQGGVSIQYGDSTITRLDDGTVRIVYKDITGKQIITQRQPREKELENMAKNPSERLKEIRDEKFRLDSKWKACKNDESLNKQAIQDNWYEKTSQRLKKLEIEKLLIEASINK
jgi:hypothetical protein